MEDTLNERFPVGIEVGEAVQMLLSAVHVMDTEEVRIGDSYGRVLAADIPADTDIPPFDRSPLDGYAVRAEDTLDASAEQPVVLKVIDNVPAGHVPAVPVRTGEASRIMTGAPVPEGADAVVKYEDTVFTDTEVRISSPVRSDSNVVHAGEDVRAGQIVLSAGKAITPADAGILAGLGVARPLVYRQPKVMIISTGDELLDVSEPLSSGKIRNSSAYMLAGFLKEWGIRADVYGIVQDDTGAISKAVCDCFECADCVITTGGASVGDCDLTRSAMESAGARILFWKVRMKPGMMTAAAVRNGRLMLGLSGSPSAAAAALFLLGLPAFRKMCGRRDLYCPRIKVTLPDGFPKKSPVGRVLPGKLVFRDALPLIDIYPQQSNGMMSHWCGCNLIGMVPAGSDRIPPETVIDAYYLGV